MSSEWQRVEIGQLAKLRSGFPFKSSDWKDSGVPVIKIANVKGGRIIPDGCGFVSTEVASKSAEWYTRTGDVLIAMTGYVGEVAQVKPGESYLINQRVGRFDFTPNAEVEPTYFFYHLLHPDTRAEMEGVARGSAQPNLSAGDAHKIRIGFPPLAVQREIAVTLGALDDRITLLRETNATLEAIAQALFKSWFVDFDPVRAKMEGRAPEGMDEATAALFPDAFEASEFGLVPRGWNRCSVYDLATYINGAAYKAFEPNSQKRGFPIIKIAELKAGVTEQTAYSDVQMPDKYFIETGDILFSWSGNPDTSIDTFVWSHSPAWLNQHIFRVLPNNPHERSYLLQLLRHLKPVFAELARNKQTTGLGHVTVSDMKRLTVAKPSIELLKQFHFTVAAVHQRIFSSMQQAQILATLRDTLLPRLISGQLRLPTNPEETTP